ncbi:hypothetical protein Hdeb2414_s1209g00991911 [Helianthus debilis subsp. tardiflorus]
MLSRTLSISRVCFCLNFFLTHTLHGYLYPAHDVWSEGSDRWSEGSSIDDKTFERSAWTSKDYLSRSIIRNISFDEIEGFISSFDLLSFETDHLSSFYQLLSKSNRRMVDLVNLQH